jgi:hypothetical protein
MNARSSQDPATAVFTGSQQRLPAQLQLTGDNPQRLHYETGDLMTESTSGIELKAVLAALVGATAVLLLGVDIWQQSNKSEAEPAPAPAPPTTSEAAAPPATCGNPRVVTVEEDTPVRWELVRESESVTTACPNLTLYKDKEAVSNFELPFGVSFIDGDDGLWSYKEGAEAMPADQSVNPSELSSTWVIARTTDGRTVSAKLDDGLLSFD